MDILKVEMMVAMKVQLAVALSVLLSAMRLDFEKVGVLAEMMVVEMDENSAFWLDF